tara:strand:- start:2963 stop:3151 length:189 start_codon:yes stop_codon:yes gene_type:complete
MKVGDLVHYPDAPVRSWEGEPPLTSGIVVGFDHENDPIVFFPSRGDSAAYLMSDIEVLNESW